MEGLADERSVRPMNAARRFSFARTMAIFLKELIQMRRDRLTLAMMVGIPIVQLVLFGFAINTDPKELPSYVKVEESSRFSRALLAGLVNSGYYRIDGSVATDAAGQQLLQDGKASFVVTIPAGFERSILRGETAKLIVEADASDPAAASNAIGALNDIAARSLASELSGALAPRQEGPSVEVVVHRLYNPEGITQYNIVPGLIGTILTMTTVLSTALALTRESERGTMENLLAMPAQPAEIMIGKITPYIGLGFVQVAVILLMSKLVFYVPMVGSFALLALGLLLFIATNVTVGYLFSTLARNQMQAMQMTFFYFLPSLLLSGFMFPFRGMPEWAQWIGGFLPLTHFLRVVRGVLLKGAPMSSIAPELGAILLFFVGVALLTLLRFRRTLD
jgi:ABC-2 type transport system permease protein